MKTLKTVLLALALLFGVMAPMLAGTPDGIVVKQDATKQEIGMKELPKAAIEHIKTAHPDATFIRAVKWLNPDKSVKGYDVVIEQAGEETTLHYNAEGVAIAIKE